MEDRYRAALTKVLRVAMADSGRANSRQLKTGLGVQEISEKAFEDKSCTGQIM